MLFLRNISSSGDTFPTCPRRRRELLRSHCRGLSCLFIYLPIWEGIYIGIASSLPAVAPRKDSAVRWLLAVGRVAITRRAFRLPTPGFPRKGIASSATAFPLFPFDFFLCSSLPSPGRGLLPRQYPLHRSRIRSKTEKMTTLRYI